MSYKEEIFIRWANVGMRSFNIEEFKKTHESLYKVILASMADYGLQVKKSQSNLLDQKIDEELKRLKEENEKLVNSVGEWSALAIDRKQDLDEANKKIEELKEGIDEILDLYHGDGVINQTWILIHFKELKKSLTK